MSRPEAEAATPSVIGRERDRMPVLCDRLCDRRPLVRSGQPQTKNGKCDILGAHHNLLTDVFGSRHLICTIHQCKNSRWVSVVARKPCPLCMTGDIRAMLLASRCVRLGSIPKT